MGLHPSFSSLCRAVQSAKKANPAHAQKHRWSLDMSAIENEVEQFQVKVCLAAGWTQYLTEGGGGAPPFSLAQSLANQKQLGVAVEKIKKLWAGIKTISEWLDSNAPAVDSKLSEARAQHCLKCPFNNTDSLTEWFAAPAIGAITRQLEKISERKLSTSVDDKLGICAQKNTEGSGGCLCSLRLSVHVPIEIKLNHMAADVKAKLHPNCWVLREEKELTPQPA